MKQFRHLSAADTSEDVRRTIRVELKSVEVPLHLLTSTLPTGVVSAECGLHAGWLFMRVHAGWCVRCTSGIGIVADSIRVLGPELGVTQGRHSREAAPVVELTASTISGLRVLVALILATTSHQRAPERVQPHRGHVSVVKFTEVC